MAKCFRLIDNTLKCMLCFTNEKTSFLNVPPIRINPRTYAQSNIPQHRGTKVGEGGGGAINWEKKGISVTFIP